MRTKIFLLVSVILCSAAAQAQFPKIGNDSLLDIATWNVEWLGEPDYGPTNEAQQYTNVQNLMVQTDFDVVAMQEMSNTATFFNLSSYLFPKYGAVNSTFTATQKMCFFYKRSMFEVIPSLTQNILTQYNYTPFATRPPLQVALQTIGGTKTDTLYFIVVHLKAHTGTTTEKAAAYTKRHDAANLVIQYIQQNLSNKKCIVLGDWNDDLNTSIYNNAVSPFKQIQDSGYFFATRKLSDAGKKSYAFGTKMIDHIMLTSPIKDYYIPASAQVFDLANNYLSGFSNSTSDHYPVYTFYDWKKLTTLPPPPNTTSIQTPASPFITIYPNPAQNTLQLSLAAPIAIYNITGNEVFSSVQPQNEYTISHLPSGVYYLKIFLGEHTHTQKLIIRR